MAWPSEEAFPRRARVKPQRPRMPATGLGYAGGVSVSGPVPLDVAPMLARLARELPVDAGHDWRYEPKWDGFRCLAFRDGARVDLRSRNRRPFERYFPEVVEALAALPVDSFVLDGELLVAGPGGADFEALLLRLHPSASRVERLRRETPATFVAFDVLELGGDDMREAPYDERRDRLARLLDGVTGPRLVLTPSTDDPDVARAWLDHAGAGIDGVVAKAAGLRYEPGRRVMVKVKLERTVDCVVAGMRALDGGAVASLLLGLYDDQTEESPGSPVLRHVGVVTSFTAAVRRALGEELGSLVVALAGHPWEHGFHLAASPVGRLKGAAGRWTPDLEPDWVPLAPVRVCEVAYDRYEQARFRHPAQWRRWRPDRDPRSCTFAQLDDRAAGAS